MLCNYYVQMERVKIRKTGKWGGSVKRKAVIGILIVIAAIGVFALWRHNSRNYNRVLGDKENIETPETIKIATYNIKTREFDT